MKKLIISLLLISFILLTVLSVNAVEEEKSYIIGFKEKPDVALVKEHGGKIIYQYSIIPAIAANLPPQAIEGLMHNSKIAYIEEDSEVFAVSESLPWGVDRIDADRVWGDEGVPNVNPGYNAGAGVGVAILDTGIDKDHPDLAANIKGGINFVPGIYDLVDTNDWDDYHGHGSHVAGTVAAIDNDIGVIGVAPEADLYAVRVLDENGEGYMSDVIAGIDWVVGNHVDDIQVISMSLGGNASDSLDQACQKAYNAGIIIVAAAGNNYGGAVIYPAAYPSVIAVSSTTSYDILSSFSSVGPEVELAAPGSSIYSTYKNGGYATLSGTSMAAPHVSGTAALVIAANPGISNIEVRQILQDTADDLGDPGWDISYGYGLVDAYEAAVSIGTNQPPVADNQLVTTQKGTAINIALTGSDGDGDDLTYTIDSGPSKGTLSGTAPEITYSPNSDYIGEDSFTFKVNDTKEDSDPATVSIIVTEAKPTMHIASIDVYFNNIKSAGPNIFGYATAVVTIVNENGISVQNATVSGLWSDATSDSDYGITDALGEVLLKSDQVKVRSGVKFTFTVDDVMHSGFTYNASANIEDQDDIIVP